MGLAQLNLHFLVNSLSQPFHQEGLQQLFASMHLDPMELEGFFDLNLVAKALVDIRLANQHLDKHLLQVELIITTIMAKFQDIRLEVQVL